MASQGGDLQGFATQRTLGTHIDRVAEELYRADRRNVHASLSELGFDEQRVYRRIATAMVLASDEERLRPAVYAAADRLTPGGLDRLTRAQRLEAVKGFIDAFQVMKAALNGELHPDTANLLRSLVRHDLARDAQPVNTKPASAINLRDLDVPTEVM